MRFVIGPVQVLGDPKGIFRGTEQGVMIIRRVVLDTSWSVVGNHDRSDVAAAVHNVHVQRFVKDDDENAIGKRGRLD